MVGADQRNELIRRFLAGEMQGEELDKFQGLLKEDPELQATLDRESGVEALLHDAVGGPVADIRYEALVGKVVGPPDVGSAKGKAQVWLRVYAVAATLVLVALGGYALRSRFSSPKTAPLTAVDRKGPLSVPENGKSITRLSQRALLIAEEGTKARVFKDTDSTVRVVIAQGNAYFDVSGEKGSHVSVVTPHSAMTLEGTVFRVVVTELETEITVLEGAVEVVHRNDLDSPRVLLAGGTVFADYRSLQTAESLAPEMCERRTSLLRSYVGWVQQQMHG